MSFNPFAHHAPESAQFLDHPSHAPLGIRAFPDRLYVVTIIEDPLRYRARYKHYWEFEKHVRDSGAILLTVELAYGNRPFEVTNGESPWHLQLRAHDEMFHKENLGNLGAARLPHGARYLAFVDADMQFTRPDWAQETLQQLQHFDAVQMFSSYSDLGPNHQVLQTTPSMMWNYYHRADMRSPGHPDRPKEFWRECGRELDAAQAAAIALKKWIPGATGGAWAYRMEAFELLGGLMDRAIVGSGDWYMAFGLIQDADWKLQQEVGNCIPEYRRYVHNWIDQARELKGNIGYVEGHLIHKWHGSKKNRGYETRWRILEENEFNPYADLKVNRYGVYEWSGNKPRLRNEMRRYFRSRDEDSTAL